MTLRGFLLFWLLGCAGFGQVAWLERPGEIHVGFAKEAVKHRRVSAASAKGQAIPLQALRLGFELRTLHLHIDPQAKPATVWIETLGRSLPVHTNGVPARWLGPTDKVVWEGWLPEGSLKRGHELLGQTESWGRLSRARGKGGRLVRGPLPKAIEAPQHDLGKLLLVKVGCLACHRHGGRGAAIGPPLDVFGEADVPRVRRKLMDPFSSVHPDFLQRQVTFANGTSTVGVVRPEKDKIVVADHTGSEQRYPQAAVQSVYNMAGTIMPPHLLEEATAAEVEALVRFLCLDK